MSANFPLVFESGRWEIDVGQRQLRLRGVPVPIGSRAFDIVEKLVRSEGQYVSKDALMATLWGHTAGKENTLHVHISAIRKVLGPDRSMLRTDGRRGYALFGGWTPRQDCDRVKPPPAHAPVPVAKGNLPAGASELIGRARAMDQLRDAFSTFRAVTLTGPGGIGKTALALEVARNLPTDFDDGRWLVDLASLSVPNLVPAAVAAALGLKPEEEAISVASISRAIGNRKVLVVIDN
jgi:DNA-binding winged helix-turn-helix (wHTH) protein